jgi:hypothetical protein
MKDLLCPPLILFLLSLFVVPLLFLLCPGMTWRGW